MDSFRWLRRETKRTDRREANFPGGPVPGRFCLISNRVVNGYEVKTGTLRSIIRQSGDPRAEFET
jgi:hypothetical protein